jgi:putative flippase GtrA
VFSAGVTWGVSVALVYRVFPYLAFRYHPELVAHVIGLCFSAVTSFIGHSRFSFRKNA